jgi:phosphoribosylformylglycinamidine synthase
VTKFQVAVHIVPRKGLLDPQGKAVAEALHTLGFAAVGDVHVGRHMIIETTAKDAAAAQASVKEMCAKLLANPVTEDFEIASVTS